MIVSASKVSTLCSSSELALVMASRQPELNRLTPAQLKSLALRARKLFEKANDQGRNQARAKSRKLGAGLVAPRTVLKSQVFADALHSFEARRTKLEATPTGSGAATRPKTKKVRNASHRATRASVRKKLAAH
jgi:hypothetical protein